MPWEKTENEIRHRIKEPSDFIEGSFRTKDIGDGISLIMGKLKDGNGSMITQAIRFDKAKWDIEKAKDWMSNHEEQFNKSMMHNLDGVEIFASGEWNGDKYSEKDLDEMVKAFVETSHKFRPPLKLGHDEAQTLLQRDGLPAAGWISNIYRVGKKLLADFVEIPEKVYDLLKRGAYKKVSSEIYWNANVEGIKYKRLLGAVALLGADLPAVTALSDIFQMYAADVGELKSYDLKEFKVTITTDLRTMGDNMDEKVLEQKLQENEKRVFALETELKQKIIEAAAMKEESEKLKAQVEVFEKKIFEAEIEKTIVELGTESLITPAMKPFVKELLIADKHEYAFQVQGKDVKFSKPALIKEILKLHSASTSTVNTDEDSEDSKTVNGNENSEKALQQKIEKYAKEHNVSFKDAYKSVMKEHSHALIDGSVDA